MGEMIYVGRYQLPLDLQIKKSLYRLKKKRSKATFENYLLAADATTIVDAKGSRSLYSYICKEDNAALTLTQREADLIALANPGMPPPRALETIHPWLPQQKYMSQASQGYRSLLAVIRRYGRHFFSTSTYCDKSWNTICNSLRLTNPLEARFDSAWHLPLQNAFVLEESRPDHEVIAIDFNSLYPACMQQVFPKPSQLRKVSLQRNFVIGETLPVGLYRCHLSGDVSEFIKKYNPFRSFFSGRYLGVSLTKGITVDLNEFEIGFYKRHFQKVHLVEAIVSDHVVAHPLALEARRVFAMRKSYQQQNNKPLADREKFRMTLLASCASRPIREKKNFRELSAAIEYLKRQYGVEPYNGEPSVAFIKRLRFGRVSLTRDAGEYVVTGPSLYDGSACPSLGQRIVARARNMVMEEIENIVDTYSNVGICYINIDSIHLSVPKQVFDMVHKRLQDHASTEMGCYKIEAISKYGLWLEAGRYWLYNSDSVKKFSNKGVGDGVNPFKDHKIFVSNREIEGLHIPIKSTLDMAGSMSDAYGLKYDEYAGVTFQSSLEIENKMNYGDVLKRLNMHRDNAVPVKVAAFRKLCACMAAEENVPHIAATM